MKNAIIAIDSDATMLATFPVGFPPPIRTSIPASEFRCCLKAGNMNRFGLHLRCGASKLISHSVATSIIPNRPPPVRRCRGAAMNKAMSLCS